MSDTVNVPVELTLDEANLLMEIGQAELPGAEITVLIEWAKMVAKNGLRDELWRVKTGQLRAQEQANREIERDAFDTTWPREVPAEVLNEPAEPVEEPPA